MRKLTVAEFTGKKFQKETLFHNLHFRTSVLSDVNTKDLPSVTPLPDRGKRKRKNRLVFLEKYEGPVIPELEKLTPLPIQEPIDHFDFSDPTNDLIKQMKR